MTENTQNDTPDNPFTWPRARKGYSAGIASGVLAGGTAIGAAFADGTVSAGEAGTVIATTVIAFVGGFFTTWLTPANAKKH